HEEVVLDLVDFDDLGCVRLRLLHGRDRHRQRADRDQRAQHHASLHDIPPGKKTRCTNQNAPAAMTTIDPANANCRPAASLRDRSAASAVAIATTTASWPISTPRLNETSDHASARRGRSLTRSTHA